MDVFTFFIVVFILIYFLQTHAIVKLQCVCENKDTVCVVRTLLLTNKNDKENCSSRDTTISRKNPLTGEQRNLGCLQQESVVEMCNLIGVSKAILNNVIFCHQENSDWPLGEGKKVKEIFDEIFDTTKYNKAMDYIRAQRDRLKKELPSIKIGYDAALNYKREADSKKQLIYNNTQKRDQSMRDLHNIDETLKPLNETYHELTKKSLNISKRSNQYDNKKTERDVKLEACKKLEFSIKQLFSGDKSELESKVKNFESTLIEKRSDLKKQEVLKVQHVQEEKQMHARINEAQVKLGKLKRDEESHKKLNDSFKTKLNNLADALSLDITAKSQYTHEEGDEFIKLSQGTIDKHLSDITILERTFTDQENADQVKIDSLRETKASLESQIKYLNEQIKSNKKESNSVTTKINEVTHAQSTLETLQAKLNRVNAQIEELSQELNAETLKNDIEKWKVERNDMEDDLSALEAEITYLQAQNITLAEIKSLKTREELKLADIEDLKKKHHDAFASLFGILPEENFKISLNETLKSNTHDMKKIQKEINAKEKQLYTLEANVSNEEKKRKELMRNLSEYEDRLDSGVGKDKHLEDEIERITLELKKEQEDVSMLSSREYIFNRYIEKLNENEPRCPLCKRCFESDYSVPELVNDLKTKVENIPQDTTNGKAKVKLLAKHQSNLQALKPVFEDICQLKEVKIPAIEKSISDMKDKVIAVKGELKKLKTDLEIPMEKENVGQTLRGDVTLLDQNIKDLKSIRRDLEKQESKITGSKVTESNLEETLEKQKARRNEVGILRSRIDDSQTRLSTHNEKMQSLQQQKNEIHSKQLTLQGGAGVLKDLEDRKSVLLAEETKYQTEKEEVSTKIAPIETQLKLAMSELETLKKEHRNKLKEERQKIQNYSQQLGEVKRLNQDILSYAKRGILTQLTEIGDTLNSLIQKKEDILAKKANCESVINEINQFISNQSLEKIDLEKNMDLIDKKQEMIRLDEEVETLGRDINELDQRKIDKEIHEVFKKKEKLLSDEANIQGRIQEIDEIIKTTENDLKKDYLKNADQKFLRYAYKVSYSLYSSIIVFSSFKSSYKTTYLLPCDKLIRP